MAANTVVDYCLTNEWSSSSQTLSLMRQTNHIEERWEPEDNINHNMTFKS